MDITKVEYRSKKFNWSSKVEKSINKLKKSLTTNRIWGYIDLLLPTIIETDISHFLISMIISELEDSEF
jgi:hypothetical protein